MQYKTGTATVTNGSATVTGSGTQWLNEIQAGHVFVRAQLVSGKRVDDPVVYTVAGVQSNTQLTLTAPYSGTSGSGQLYGITRDLTPMGKPLLAPSSIGTVPIFNEAVLKLEQQSNQLADGLGTAAFRNVATTAQAIAGTAGVLPDAEGVKAYVSQFGFDGNVQLVTSGDANTFITPGTQVVLTGQVLNVPVALITWRLEVLGSHSDGRVIQRFTAIDTTVFSYRKFERYRRENGDWTPHVELHHTGNGASNAETQTGTDTEKWISPAALSSRTATETRTGLVEKATNDEALAGAVDKFPDAAGVKAHVDSRVTQSATDTTAGRLLKVGDFGFGRSNSPSLGFDFNTDFDFSGFISPTLGANSQNSPYPSWGGVISYRNESSTQAGQMYLSNASLASATMPRLHIRTRPANGNYTPWRELYHTGNIVGTVSQSGGVPTGAIIQRGSNANGEFVRYADGTQICTLLLTVPSGSKTSYDFTWFYPSSFLSTPSLSGYARLIETDVVARRSIVTSGTQIPVSTTASFTARSFDGSVFDAGVLTLTAIGRWY